MYFCGCERKVKACFGVEGGKAQWCKACIPEGIHAIDVVHPICFCGKRAYFALPDSKKPVWCSKKCAPDEAVNVSLKKCKTCKITSATFGKPNTTKALWCFKCKEDDAVDVKHKLCPCGTRPSIGFEMNKPIYCVDCPDKPDDALKTDSTSKICEKCSVYLAVYGYVKREPKFCKGCKPEDDEDCWNVMNKLCPCGEKPIHGLVRGQPRWCSDCSDKPEETIVAIHKLCECGRVQPTYGILGGTARWCYICKTKPEDAVDVSNKRCLCGNSRATIGLEGGEALYCAKCPMKPDNAVNVTKWRCGCGYIPSFCIDNGPLRFCKSCKPDNAKRKNDRLCSCSRVRASYGIQTGIALYCAECKWKDPYAASICDRYCKEEGCMRYIKLPYIYCSVHDPESRRRSGAKQAVVYQHLLTTMNKNLADAMKQEVIFTQDCGYKRYRGDIVIPIEDYRNIFVEIDEYEHGPDNGFYDFRGSGQYTAQCETKRMCEISNENGLPTLFVRFNTDIQRDRKGMPITKIAKDRLRLLTQIVEKYSKMEIVPNFMVIFMFYSENRFEEICDQFVNGSEDDDWVGHGQDIRQYLHLVSYKDPLTFLEK